MQKQIEDIEKKVEGIIMEHCDEVEGHSECLRNDINSLLQAMYTKGREDAFAEKLDCDCECHSGSMDCEAKCNVCFNQG